LEKEFSTASNDGYRCQTTYSDSNFYILIMASIVMRPRRALRVGTPDPALPVDGLIRKERPKWRDMACKFAPARVRVSLPFVEFEFDIQERLCG
jgi:hypothetical protein